MAQLKALAAQEHYEARVSAESLRNDVIGYPPRDDAEDTAMARAERWMRVQINQWIGRADVRMAMHAQLDALMASVWRADAEADRYVVTVAGEIVASLDAHERHLAMAGVPMDLPW